MHPLFRTQTRPDPEELQESKTSAGAGGNTMMGWPTSRMSGTGQTTPPPASDSSYNTYESDSNDNGGDDDSYEQATQDGTNTQYETDSTHSNDTNSRDGWGSGSGSSHEKEDDDSGSEGGSRNSFSGSGSDHHGSHDGGDNNDDDDDDDQDDEFWNRYSGGTNNDDDDDDDDDDDHEKGWRTSYGKKGPGSLDRTADEFDDEFGFADAFPSVSPNAPTAGSSKNKTRLSIGSNGRQRRMSYSGVPSLSCPKGKFGKRLLIGLAVLIVAAAVIISLYMFVGRDKESAPQPSEQGETESPSQASGPSSPTTSPSLPLGQVEASIIFLGFVEDAVEEGVTVEMVENDLISAFDELAPQILKELNQSTDNVTESQGDEIGLRRNLDELSIKGPVLVDVVELDCPTVQMVEDGYLCIEISTTIDLITDDESEAEIYADAMVTAVEDGRLSESLLDIGSNISIIFYIEEIPPDFMPDSNETNSTSAPGTDSTSRPSDQSGGNESTAPTSAPSNFTAPTSAPNNSTGGDPDESDPNCVDTTEFCSEWAAREPSECERNPDYMAATCPKSCDVCGDVTESPGNETATDSPSPTPSPSSGGTNNETDTNPTQSPSTDDDDDDDDSTEAPSSSAPCSDDRDQCPAWAAAGECTNNPKFMLKSCKQSCGECGTDGDETPCDDVKEECQVWADAGECENNPSYMLVSCKKSCDKCEAPDEDDVCKDSRDECRAWSEVGECENNPAFMYQNCKLSCEACTKSSPTDSPAGRV